MSKVGLVVIGMLPVIVVAAGMIRAIVETRDPLLRDSSNPAKHLLWPLWSPRMRSAMLWAMIVYLGALLLVAVIVR